MVIVRGLIGFLTLLIITRMLGKQQRGQLTYFDYVLGITMGTITGNIITNLGSKGWTPWIGLLTIVSSAVILDRFSMKWRPVAKYLNGEPTVVVMNGQIMEKALGQMRFLASDLLEQLRQQGVFDLAQVEFAVLEEDGKLSILKKSQYQPVTPRDLNIPTSYQGISTELIYDGVVIPENLEQVYLNRAWLDTQLRQRGITDPSQVFLATLDTAGNLYIDTYQDHIRSLTDISDYPGSN